MDGRTERESVGFTEKWFHGIIILREDKWYCGTIFDITGEFYEIIKKSIHIHICIYAERFRSGRISGKRFRWAKTFGYPVHPWSAFSFEQLSNDCRRDTAGDRRVCPAENIDQWAWEREYRYTHIGWRRLLYGNSDTDCIWHWGRRTADAWISGLWCDNSGKSWIWLRLRWSGRYAERRSQFRRKPSQDGCV